MERETTDGFPAEQELTAITLHGKKFNGLTIENREFYDCRIDNCTFQETAFYFCRFYDCIFEQCDLSMTHLNGSHFQSTRFHKTSLVGVDWTKLDWRINSIQPPFHFDQCNLSYNSFFGCSLKNCQVTDCAIKETDFAEADLTNANLRGSDLTRSRFFHTNLTSTNLVEAQNYDINATCNTLKQTKFSLPEAISLLHSMDIIIEE